jgi:hypothetical protein
MMRLLLMFAALPLLAQTTIKPDQLRAAKPEGAPLLLACNQAGCTPVRLGPGITARIDGEFFVIEVAAAKPRIVRTRAQVAAAADGSYPLAENGTLFRNGLAMTAGVDYTWSAGRATPRAPWAADDIVAAEELEIK